MKETSADGEKIYRLNPDGTAGALAFTHRGNPVYELQQIGSRLYYTDSDPQAAVPAPGEKRYLYRVAAAGGTPTALAETFCYGFYAYRDDFYLFDEKEDTLRKLYRIDGDTGKREFVCELPLQSVYTGFYNGAVYYGVCGGEKEILAHQITLNQTSAGASKS